MSALRLLVVGVHWPPETFIWRRLRSLASRGVQVTVVTPTANARPLADEPAIQPVSVPRWNAPIATTVARLVATGVTSALSSPAARHFLGDVLREATRPAATYQTLRRFVPVVGLEPDIVHFEWTSAAIDYLPMWDVWQVPVVISCRGTQINVRPLENDRAFLDGLREVFGRASAVHCVSRAIRDEAVSLGLDPARATIIPPAVDTTLFSPASRVLAPASALRVVAVGGWSWVKGYEYALSAIRKLVDRGVAVRFVLVGDGPERQRVLYTVADLGLVDHVELTGRLDQERVIAMLRSCDVALLSSVSEGVSNAVIEAMACGLAVVTTDCGGMREVVSDGEQGFVVPMRDVDAMADALARLAGDPALRDRMGRAARARATMHHDLADQASRFLELYEQVRS